MFPTLNHCIATLFFGQIAAGLAREPAVGIDTSDAAVAVHSYPPDVVIIPPAGGSRRVMMFIL